ncbi:HAD family hydrolase [Microcystis aeruginosa]|uniref:HAD family hydrolase n=1 Tax=Microcystis aeruginosa TaxID=1126 RepID=UPI00232FD77F|nr:HAD family hydrolase [Microcystis aeruginosa]MDB9414753.1 HAD family hydrolase [Microcystis aeruginosa CS-567/02]
MSQPPRILALDFDGVLCDGMIEYFQISKRTYETLWPETIPEDFFPRFSQLRPVIETGWEMPLLLRSLVFGIPDEEALNNWPLIRQNLLEREKIAKKVLSNALDGLRDRWIESDLESWLALHQFYQPAIDRLASLLDSDFLVYIITTKESRFVKQLLQKVAINFPAARLIGKEIKQPKYLTIQQILADLPEYPANFWFVEDRLDALELVQQQADLNDVGLYLADWGYNTAQMRQKVAQDTRIKLLSLSQFAADFTHW